MPVSGKGCVRQWRQALGPLSALRQGVTTRFSYNATVSACERLAAISARERQWQQALGLLSAKRQCAHVISYCTASSACEWQAAISACEWQWQQALGLLSVMLQGLPLVLVTVRLAGPVAGSLQSVPVSGYGSRHWVLSLTRQGATACYYHSATISACELQGCSQCL
jgi:hypothetical protein